MMNPWSERIRFIDALRGISLAGIVMAHFGEQDLGFMPPLGRPDNIHGMADGVLEALSCILEQGKGFGIFSFMFGLSFALQMQRADRRAPGTDFRPALSGGFSSSSRLAGCTASSTAVTFSPSMPRSAFPSSFSIAFGIGGR